jgi:hypothetical protein
MALAVAALTPAGRRWQTRRFNSWRAGLAGELRCNVKPRLPKPPIDADVQTEPLPRAKLVALTWVSRGNV